MMNRIARVGISAAALAAVSLSASCTQQQEALIIVAALPVSPEADGASCSAGDSASGAFLSRGVADISFNTGYAAAFSVLNNLSQTTAAGTNTGIEASEMKLIDAVVELSTPANPELTAGLDSSVTRFSVPLATSSFSGQETYSTFVFVPEANISQIAAAMSAGGVDSTTMELSVIFRAQRSSNAGAGKSGIVESRSFELPVDLCNGCLRDNSTCADASDANPSIGSGGACGNAQGFGNSVVSACCDADASNDAAAGC